MRVCAICSSVITYVSPSGKTAWFIDPTGYHCSRCHAKIYGIKNKERIRQTSIEWRKQNLERARETSKKWARANPEKVRAKSLRWRQKHPEKSKEHTARYRGRLLNFKGKFIWLPFNPRTGICSKCGRSVSKGEIKVTNLHHTQYDESDPLAHTIELCVDCHNREDPRVRNEKGQFAKIESL